MHSLVFLFLSIHYHIKFDVPSFIHSKDTIVAQNKKNGSRFVWGAQCTCRYKWCIVHCIVSYVQTSKAMCVVGFAKAIWPRLTSHIHYFHSSVLNYWRSLRSQFLK